MDEATAELVSMLRSWLGDDGIDFFSNVYEEHGTLNAVWMEETKVGPIPHPVHFREGMQVRNFLRSTGLCDDWTDHDLDNRWEALVLQATGEQEDG